MLHARSASDFGERRNGDLIRTLMDDPAHASFAAAQLGLDAAHGLAVAAFSIVRPETGSLESVREIQRLLHLVTTVCNIQFNTSHSALIDSVVYALLPCEGTAPRAVHRRVVQEIGAYAHTISSYPLIAAVGGIAPGWRTCQVQIRSAANAAISTAPAAAIGFQRRATPAAEGFSRTTGSR